MYVSLCISLYVRTHTSPSQDLLRGASPPKTPLIQGRSRANPERIGVMPRKNINALGKPQGVKRAVRKAEEVMLFANTQSALTQKVLLSPEVAKALYEVGLLTKKD
jgi:hypothetical protein